MRKLVALVSGILVVALISTVHAWNHVGHMTSAAIAYADLKERNAAVITRVVKVLKQHPHFQSMWAPKLEKVSSEERDLCLFMLASTWPDDIRKKHLDYSKPEWHYVNIPFGPEKADGKIPRGSEHTHGFTREPVNRGFGFRNGSGPGRGPVLAVPPHGRHYPTVAHHCACERTTSGPEGRPGRKRALREDEARR